jgi:hypothetical protein
MHILELSFRSDYYEAILCNIQSSEYLWPTRPTVYALGFSFTRSFRTTPCARNVGNLLISPLRNPSLNWCQRDVPVAGSIKEVDTWSYSKLSFDVGFSAMVIFWKQVFVLVTLVPGLPLSTRVAHCPHRAHWEERVQLVFELPTTNFAPKPSYARVSRCSRVSAELWW